MSSDRNVAIEAGAVSLSDLLTRVGWASLLPQLTAAQVQLLQRYLDAAATDAAIDKQTTDLHNKNTTNQGGRWVTNPEAQRKIDRLRRDYVPLSQIDDAVRIYLDKALDPKALAPITDNPDEKDYLQSVRKRLDGKGVWLRIDRDLVHDPEDPSKWIYDGTHFTPRLSLGPNGDEIPTKTGLIDRQALLLTGIIAALYWKYVDKGPVVQWLDRQMKLLDTHIKDGIEVHNEMVRIRDSTPAPIYNISDKLGGASFPKLEIWDGPLKISNIALDLKNKGRVWGASMVLMLGATSVLSINAMLSIYTDKSMAGAALGLKIAEITAAVSAILLTGFALLPYAAGGAAGAAGAEAAGGASVDGALGRIMARAQAENPEWARVLNSMGNVPMPKGAILRALPPP